MKSARISRASGLHRNKRATLFQTFTVWLVGLFVLAIFPPPQAAAQEKPQTAAEKVEHAEKEMEEATKKLSDAEKAVDDTIDKYFGPNAPQNAQDLFKAWQGGVKTAKDDFNNAVKKAQAAFQKAAGLGAFLPVGVKSQKAKDAVEEYEGWKEIAKAGAARVDDAAYEFEEKVKDALKQIDAQTGTSVVDDLEKAKSDAAWAEKALKEAEEAQDAEKKEQKKPEKKPEKKKEKKKKEKPSLTEPDETGGGNDSLTSLILAGKIKVDSAGTGETIGHVADLIIANVTDEPLDCVVPGVILESRSGQNQHYACRKGPRISLDPHGTATVPMDGVCLDRSKPPVGKGHHGDLAVNDGEPGVPRHPDSLLRSHDANKLLRLAESKYDAADKLEKDGLLKDLPYKDKQKRKDIVVQWSTWMDPEISEITGNPPATKKDLEKVVYKQLEEQGPVTPEKKKKVDEGIDTIFDKIELTSKKAKDLERPDLFPEAPKGHGEPVGMPTPGTGTTERPTATPTPESTGTPTSTPAGNTEEKKNKPPEKTVSKPLEKPCPNAKLLVRHAYSECGPDGFWHVVEDAYYDCPPVKSFRVFDFQTDQKCTAGQAPPTGLIGPAYKEFEGGSTDCQSPKPTDEFIFVSECIGGFWAMKTYRIYECLDGTKRIKSPPEKLVQSTTECTKPPPAPSH